MNSSPLRFLLSFPVITALILGSVIAWTWIDGHVARSAALILLPALWLVLTAVWWVLRGRGARLKRLGVVALLGVAVATVLALTVRREGSADGTAFPKFTWRWTKPSVVDLPAIAETPAPKADVGPPPTGVADFTRFMGVNGDGVIPDAGIQTDWKTHAPRELWRIPIGLGWPGFAVAGRRAITQEQRGEEEYVTCYDITNGSLLWSHKDRARFSEGMGGDGPRATPTLDLEKKLVYSLGATGILNCLELETGKLVWSRNILSESGTENLVWAKSIAPLLVGELVVVSGGAGAPTLFAMKRDTGEIVWKAGVDGASYSSPVVRTLGGKEQIVSVNASSVTGHDIATGDVFWTFDWPPNAYAKVGQPILAGTDRLLVTASYGMKSHLLQITKDGSGKFSCAPVWTSTTPRTKFSSAAVIGNHAYALDEGTLACVNLADGERVWRDGRYGFGQHLVVGDHLLIQTEPGDVVLVKANPEMLEEVGRIKALSSKTWNPPTLAGRYLLVRNDREAVCFEIPAKAP
jgi:outer membrane protein assembly factor BamB